MKYLNIILLGLLLGSCKALIGIPLDNIEAKAEANVEASVDANIAAVQSNSQITGDGAMITIKDSIPWIFGTVAVVVLAIACKNISITGRYHIEAGKGALSDDD